MSGGSARVHKPRSREEEDGLLLFGDTSRPVLQQSSAPQGRPWGHYRKLSGPSAPFDRGGFVVRGASDL
jgi:hypothetical protein